MPTLSCIAAAILLVACCGATTAVAALPGSTCRCIPYQPASVADWLCGAQTCSSAHRRLLTAAPKTSPSPSPSPSPSLFQPAAVCRCVGVHAAQNTSCIMLPCFWMLFQHLFRPHNEVHTINLAGRPLNSTSTLDATEPLPCFLKHNWAALVAAQGLLGVSAIQV